MQEHFFFLHNPIHKNVTSQYLWKAQQESNLYYNSTLRTVLYLSQQFSNNLFENVFYEKQLSRVARSWTTYKFIKQINKQRNSTIPLLSVPFLPWTQPTFYDHAEDDGICHHQPFEALWAYCLSSDHWDLPSVTISSSATEESKPLASV